MKRITILSMTTAFLVVGCGKKEDPGPEPIRSVRAMKVGDLEGFVGRSFPGRARAAQEVDLAFRVSGPLSSFNVNVGDEVPQEQLIASIDPTDFDVALRNAQAGLQRAKATAARAESDLERMKSAVKANPGAVSERAVDEASEAKQVAAADIASFEASVEEAQNARNYTELRAPFAGTIVATYVENFENVREKEIVVRLLNKDQIEFEVGIPESLISMADYVKDITITFDAFPDSPVPAKVTEIGREASAVTRTFPVTATLEQPEEFEILPGMAGRGTGKPPPGSEDSIGLVVPVTAVFAPGSEGENVVWDIDEASNSVSRRPVKLGDLLSTGYVVKSGLEQGEMIATAGVHFLEEGQEVVPQLQ